MGNECNTEWKWEQHRRVLQGEHTRGELMGYKGAHEGKDAQKRNKGTRMGVRDE